MTTVVWLLLFRYYDHFVIVSIHDTETHCEQAKWETVDDDIWDRMCVPWRLEETPKKWYQRFS